MKKLEIEITYKAKYNYNVNAKTDKEASEIFERDKEKIEELLMENYEFCIDEELTNIELINIKNIE